MNPVSNNSSALAQIMQMMQQVLAQSNPTAAHAVSSDSTSTSSTGISSSATSNNGLVTGGTPLNGDMLVVLLQAQDTGSSAGTSGQPSGQQSGFGQDFQQLVQAIQSGDLTAAQQAFTTLNQLIEGNSSQSGATDGSAATGSQTSPFLQALNQIGSDLQSGDITDAQTALTSLTQQMQSHQHHHQGGGGAGGNGGGGGGDIAAVGLLSTGGDASSSSSGSSADASSTVVSEVATPNADGSITITTTNADGSTTVSSVPADQVGSGVATGTNSSRRCNGLCNDGGRNGNGHDGSFDTRIEQRQRVIESASAPSSNRSRPAKAEQSISGRKPARTHPSGAPGPCG